MLIVAGGTRADRFLAQTGIERFPMEIGEFVEQRFRLGTGGENAPDCRQGEGAEADRAFQSLVHIVALILSQERQELLCLQFALDLLGEQAVEERQRDRAEFTEALTQEQLALIRIVGGMVALERLPNAGLGAGHGGTAGG